MPWLRSSQAYGGELDEQQELYAELGLDSPGLVLLLVELWGKPGAQVVNADLMMTRPGFSGSQAATWKRRNGSSTV